MQQHEQLAERIVVIITRLNMGETLDIHELIDEFKVSKRTLQRDINDRLAFLPIQKNGAKLSLEKLHLGKLGLQDIRNFASIAGVNDIFPSLDSHFLIDLLATAYNSEFIIKPEQSENKTEIDTILRRLKKIITQAQKVSFNYKGKEYRFVDPYQLVNVRGVWYLASDDNGQLKSFHVGKLVNLVPLSETFTPDLELKKQIEQEEGIYFGQEKIEVIVKVASSVATYFKRRSLLPEQELIKELDEGGLLLSCKVAQPIQITTLIKHWMPHLTIIGSNELQQQIINDIYIYLDNTP